MKLHQFKITCTRCGADVTFKKCRCDDKRKPLPDGTLELKDEELDEINNLMKGKKAWNPHDGEISGGHKIIKMRLNIDDYIFCKYSGYDDEFASERKVVDIKAIAYLLERFELIKED